MSQEGVIKYRLDFTSGPSQPADGLRELNAWRTILFRLELIGQDPRRYGGLGFGNISQRWEPFSAPPEERRFVVSGTQTGGLPELDPRHYSLVLECHPRENRLVAQGPIQPSSEALTHGTLYGLDDSLRFVMHVHSPLIWRRARHLGLPLTDPSAAYGTPEMAEEVGRLMADPQVRRLGIFAMGGHEDGLVAFGREAEAAGVILIHYLSLALQYPLD